MLCRIFAAAFVSDVREPAERARKERKVSGLLPLAMLPEDEKRSSPVKGASIPQLALSLGSVDFTIDYFMLFTHADADRSSERPLAAPPKTISSSIGSISKAQALATAKMHLVDDDELYDEDQLFAKQSSLLSPHKQNTTRIMGADEDEFDF